MNTERERLLDEVVTAYLKAAEAGHVPDRGELLARHPELAADLAEFFAAESQVNRAAAPLRAEADTPTTGMHGPVSTGPGTRVEYVGDYHLLTEIGRGGMGVVYKARQETLNRTVALKMILSGQLATEADVRRFRAEAEAAARLDHPGIVAVYEVGQHEGQHYFSMAFVEGESLAHRLAQGLLAPREAAELTRKVAEAVAYAHIEGVVHRDLKPANILIDRNGQPRLTDFGLAKRVEDDGSLTATGQILGTPSYMPPEQASGRGDAIGPLSDVYSLGAILYCLLTGRPPFQADNPLDTLLQVLHSDPVPPRQLNAAIPRDLETICLKCLEKDAHKRYASAQELAADLGRFLGGLPILARPVGSFERAWRWCRRNPVVAGMAAALMLVLVSGTVTSAVLARAAKREADVSRTLAAEKTTLADRAAASERLTRRYLYSAHLNLAHEAWKSGNVLRMEELLHQHRPGANEDNLPSFEWGHLWQQINRQQKTITLAPASETHSVVRYAISPDGRFIAVGYAGSWCHSKGDVCTMGEVRLWDVATGTVRHTERGMMRSNADPQPEKQFQAQTFSPDGRLFALVVFDFFEVQHPYGRVREPSAPRVVVWELDTMKVRATIPLPNFALTDRIAISPDGTQLAAAYTSTPEQDKPVQFTLKVWNLPMANQPLGEGRVLRQGDVYKLGESHVTDPGLAHISFSADGKSLLWGRWSAHTLYVTPLSGEGTDATLPIVGRYHRVSPDGKYISGVTSGVTHVPLHDAKTGQELLRFPAGSMPDHVPPFGFSRDGRLLAVSRGLTVDVWDVETKNQIGDIRGHDDTVRAAGFGPDGKTVITVARNKHLGTWEARVWNATLRPGPDTVNLAANPLKRTDYPDPGVFYAADLSPDAKTLAAVWDWSRGGPNPSRQLLLHDLSSGSVGKQRLRLKWDWHDDAIVPAQFQPARVTFAPNGKRMALSGGKWEPQAVQVWRLEPSPDGLKATFERGFAALQHDSVRIPPAAFSPEGTKLVYACSPREGTSFRRFDDRLHLLDLATGKETVWPPDTEPWFPHEAGMQGSWGRGDWDGSCHGVLFTSDGRRILSVHKRNVIPWGTRIIVWDAATGEVLAVLESPVALHYGWRPMVLSQDERTLATCHDDHSILLWNVSEPELRRVQDELQRRAENPDAKPADPAAKPKVVMRGHNGHVTAVAFHPDGKTLASTSSDGTLRIWDVVTGELRLSLDAHAAAALVFTPDGDTLVSSDIRGELKFWRAKRGE